MRESSSWQPGEPRSRTAGLSLSVRARWACVPRRHSRCGAGRVAEASQRVARRRIDVRCVDCASYRKLAERCTGRGRERLGFRTPHRHAAVLGDRCESASIRGGYALNAQGRRRAVVGCGLAAVVGAALGNHDPRRFRREAQVAALRFARLGLRDARCREQRPVEVADRDAAARAARRDPRAGQHQGNPDLIGVEEFAVVEAVVTLAGELLSCAAATIWRSWIRQAALS